MMFCGSSVSRMVVLVRLVLVERAPWAVRVCFDLGGDQLARRVGVWVTTDLKRL